jgi:hypothetical protein
VEHTVDVHDVQRKMQELIEDDPILAAHMVRPEHEEEVLEAWEERR